MSISATAVRFDDDSMWVELSDGRTIGVPFAWFPRLLNATKRQREEVEIGRFGLHWEAIDEDISIAGLLAGRRDQTVRRSKPRMAAPRPQQFGAIESSSAPMKNTLLPGTPAPRSGIYEQVGPRGGRTGEQADSTRGKPLPPTERVGQTWRLMKPSHRRGGK
jgi:hypothetical protein